MKTRAEKQVLLDDLKSTLTSTNSGMVTHYRGLNVEDMTSLRQQIKASGGKLKVVKNTLAQIAIKGTAFEDATSLFEGPVALATPGEDTQELAKVIVDFAKQKKALEIKGGVIEGKVVDMEAIKTLASLPSKQELRAMLLGTFDAPARSLVTVLAAPLRDIVNVLKAREDKLVEGGEAVETSAEGEEKADQAAESAVNEDQPAEAEAKEDKPAGTEVKAEQSAEAAAEEDKPAESEGNEDKSAEGGEGE